MGCKRFGHHTHHCIVDCHIHYCFEYHYSHNTLGYSYLAGRSLLCRSCHMTRSFRRQEMVMRSSCGFRFLRVRQALGYLSYIFKWVHFYQEDHFALVYSAGSGSQHRANFPFGVNDEAHLKVIWFLLYFHLIPISNFLQQMNHFHRLSSIFPRQVHLSLIYCALICNFMNSFQDYFS